MVPGQFVRPALFLASRADRLRRVLFSLLEQPLVRLTGASYNSCAAVFEAPRGATPS